MHYERGGTNISIFQDLRFLSDSRASLINTPITESNATMLAFNKSHDIGRKDDVTSKKFVKKCAPEQTEKESSEKKLQ